MGVARMGNITFSPGYRDSGFQTPPCGRRMPSTSFAAYIYLIPPPPRCVALPVGSSSGDSPRRTENRGLERPAGWRWRLIYVYKEGVL